MIDRFILRRIRTADLRKQENKSLRSSFNMRQDLFASQSYLCLTSDMLEGLVCALVLAHPPEKLESPQPDARDFAVLDRVLQVSLFQRADRIEY